MTKTKKLVALLVVLAMVMTLVLVACNKPHECLDPCPECGLCTSECDNAACKDKCPGHKGGTTTHTCKHVCETCKKCTDTTCQDAACKDKCQGHQQQGGTHTCKHVCSTCQKCTDTTCTDPVCANNRCPGHDVDPGTYGKENAPLSITQALALADVECTTNNAYTAEEVYATGKVKSIGPTKSSAYLSEVWVTDLSDASKEIMIYSLNVNADVEKPAQNDTILFHGYIKNYNGTPQFSSNGSDYVYAVKNTRGTSTITLVNDGNATVTGLPQTATNGTEVSFTVAAPAEKQISSVKAGEKVLTSETDTYKFTVAGDVTITVEVADKGAHVAQIVYTLDTVTGAPQGSNNAYNGNCDIEVGSVTWNLEGNSQQNPWRLGGKKSTTGTDGTADRSLTSKTAIEENVSKIVIKYGGWSNSGITVNSVKLTVFKTDANDPVEIIEITDAAANGTTTIEKTSGKDWSNCCYKLTFNITIPGSSNVYISVSSMEFWA